MQGCVAQAEGAAAIADPDPGAGTTDIHVDVDLDAHVDARQHTQANTEQADDRSEYVLATDSVPLFIGRADSSRHLVHRYPAFAPAAAVGAHAIDRSARRFRRPDLQRPRKRPKLDGL